jgi:hypothetical protein
MDISHNGINIYNGIEATQQSVYDSYNKFIFSKDTTNNFQQVFIRQHFILKKLYIKIFS